MKKHALTDEDVARLTPGEPIEPKTLKEAKEIIQALRETTVSQGLCIAELRKPLEFEYASDRPFLIVKLGSKERGWVPAAHHFDRVNRILKASGMDKKYNILTYHFGIETSIV